MGGGGGGGGGGAACFLRGSSVERIRHLERGIENISKNPMEDRNIVIISKDHRSEFLGSKVDLIFLGVGRALGAVRAPR